MEVERDLTLEYGGDSESGASAGPRSATAIPEQSESDLRTGLGTKISQQIEELFIGMRLGSAEPRLPPAVERRTGRERRRD